MTLFSGAKLKAIAEESLLGYESALRELYDDRCMALAEGELAAYCRLGVFTKEEGCAWLDRIQVFRVEWLRKQRR